MLVLSPTDEASTDVVVNPPELRILLASPRGFCAGVRRAIEAVRDALRVHGSPVYVRRAIVHNAEVVRGLEAEGAIFVEEVGDVPPGAVVLFSAHGVSPAVARDAERRGLKAYDAVCPLVAKVHREVERHQQAGRKVILIGHRGHPEIDGTLGHLAPGSAALVSRAEEIRNLPISPATPVAFAVQTTYSVDDAAAIVAGLRARFSDLSGPRSSDICYATTNRQAAVHSIAGRADALIVAGDRFSSNACRLAEVAALNCAEVQQVANASEIDWSRIPARGAIGISAAASTPESVVQGIIAAIGERSTIVVEEVDVAEETTVFKPLAIA